MHVTESLIKMYASSRCTEMTHYSYGSHQGNVKGKCSFFSGEMTIPLIFKTKKKKNLFCTQRNLLLKALLSVGKNVWKSKSPSWAVRQHRYPARRTKSKVSPSMGSDPGARTFTGHFPIWRALLCQWAASSILQLAQDKIKENHLVSFGNISLLKCFRHSWEKASLKCFDLILEL